jgi:hypothetical protein
VCGTLVINRVWAHSQSRDCGLGSQALTEISASGLNPNATMWSWSCYSTLRHTFQNFLVVGDVEFLWYDLKEPHKMLDPAIQNAILHAIATKTAMLDQCKYTTVSSSITCLIRFFPSIPVQEPFKISLGVDPRQKYQAIALCSYGAPRKMLSLHHFVGHSNMTKSRW